MSFHTLPRLDLRQLDLQGIFGDFRVVARLAAQPIAVGETEKTIQAQVGIGSDTTLTRNDIALPGQTGRDSRLTVLAQRKILSFVRLNLSRIQFPSCGAHACSWL